MFTGIIYELAKIKQIKSTNIKELCIETKQEIKQGTSVAINGVCLTAIKTIKSYFWTQVSQETLKITNLQYLKINDYVNLELSLKLSDRLDGHILTGHIDGMGEISSIKEDYQVKIIEITYPANLKPYIVKKGSIAIDGISLTVADCYNNKIKLVLIPYTIKLTTLGFKNIGSKVNIEVDILAKYLEKQMTLR